MRDLHSALQTEVIANQEAQSGVQLALVKLQYGKHDVEYSLHARPGSYSSAGIQTTDLLAYLGFQRSPCTFVGDRCYARRAEVSLDLERFSQAFSQTYATIRQAEAHLDACGIFLDRPEGLGFFYNRPSGGRRRPGIGATGDGHVSPTRQSMKKSEDEGFQYAFTWIKGGREKGWTTHYRPNHWPLSPEVKSTFDFLGLRTFPECPEFDFEPCY